MSTIASGIVDTLRNGEWAAYTLTYGYACHAASGKRVLFDPAKIVSEKRNEKGRVTRYVGEYRDGSRILFTWSDSSGSRVAITGDQK